MHVIHEPTDVSFDKVGVTGKIFPSLELTNKAEFVLISTQTGHETAIIEHESDFIYYILSGNGEFAIDGVKEACAAGDLVVIPAGKKFVYSGQLKMLLVNTPPWELEQEESFIEQTYTINAPAAKVWQALTDAKTAEAWGAGPAKVDPQVGGEFSYWDGDIHGVFTKLVPQKRIEQDWYGHDNPTWKYKAVFTLEGDETTTVKLTFSGTILDAQKDIHDWQEYYFTPIKQLLEK